MQLNLHRLWIFMQVVECGGFSAAGQKLYMSQPSVSNQVRQLEQSLQVTLVDRSGARIRPSAEGQVLMEYAKRVFLLADEAVTAIRQVTGLQSGQLLVGGTSTAGTYLLPPLVARFRRRYPGIACGIMVGNGNQVMRALLDGEVGIGVLAGTLSVPQLEVEPILKERLVLVAAADHPLAGGSIPASALAGERFLVREQGSGTRELQEAALVHWGLEAVKRSEIGSSEAAKQGVIAGLGIALVSEHAVVDEVRHGRMQQLDVDPVLPSRPIVLAYRRDRLLAPAEWAFIKLLRQVRDWPDDHTESWPDAAVSG
ncbi:LysR family transcriptional regulator [Streptomyces sp. NPDC020800]|uniref:LysR family transcriptional regulator n=1 Tax=Streptomyces sp. NPDC020800 TaxID=3365092 RepID=UPI003791E842